jgi:hypothetical protein
MPQNLVTIVLAWGALLIAASESESAVANIVNPLTAIGQREIQVGSAANRQLFRRVVHSFDGRTFAEERQHRRGEDFRQHV